MNIIDKLNNKIEKVDSLVCVGLDSAIEKLPSHLQNERYPQFAFNKAIIDATATFVCAYKPNSAFYEARGEKGLKELKMTFDYIHTTYPGIVTILDAKRADIGSTNEGYVKYIFDYLGADCVTLHPYLGKEALEPFLQREDKASIILCRTSNPGAGELQDLKVKNNPLYIHVARLVSKTWNKNNNCMLVVGATYPEEMKKVRATVGDVPFLVPGIGAQGGDVEKTVKAGMDDRKRGMIINSARGIIFASKGEDFAQRAGEEAQKLRDEINKYRRT
ncbi:MAG: orotidine-5'-phosphate decarboxylase [bacterium]